MKLAVTGGTGLVGRIIVEAALSAGHAVTLLGRTPPPPATFSAPVAFLPWDLESATPPLAGQEALIHCAFRHVPGRYRGGEGDDPEGFRRANGTGSVRLFEAARDAGLARLLFLSSRAVYGAYPPGTPLAEDLPLHPDTLYGEVKRMGEAALADLHGPGCATASLRATGVYGPAGPGQRHKWADLFDDFRAGRPIAPRVATEVHGADLAAAALRLLAAPATTLGGQAFNVSDILLDRADLLAEVNRILGTTHPLPARADASSVSAMTTTRLTALGWRPGGMELLRNSLPAMLARPAA